MGLLRINSTSMNKIVFCLSLFLCLFFFSGLSVSMELPIGVDMTRFNLKDLPGPYPLTRERICLNGVWDFFPIVDEKPRHGPILEKIPPMPSEKDWKKFQVPAKWRKICAHMAAVEFDFTRDWVKANRAWYRRDFTVPASMRGKRIKLCFKGILVYTEIFVNDTSVGKHYCGVTPFELDITDVVNVEQKNTLRMYVVNSDIHYIKKSVSRYEYTSRAPIYYSYSQGSAGIWQDVYLVAEPNVVIEDVQVITSTRKKEITAKISLANYADNTFHLLVRPTVTELAGDIVNSLGFQNVTISGNSKTVLVFKKTWPNPELWSPEKPNLYRLHTEVTEDGTILDEHFQRFGFREFWCEGKDFMLNGRRISLKGDWLGLTGASPDAHLRAEYMRMYYESFKKANYLGTRVMGIDQTETALDICDEIGLPIIATGISDGPRFFDPAYMQEAMEHSLKDMQDWIRRDRNHPCILIWSTENEDQAPGKKEVFDRYLALDSTIMEIDPTRPFMHDGDGCGGGDFKGWAPIKNFHYSGRRLSLERQIHQFAKWREQGGKPFVLGEIMGCADEFTKYGGLFRQIGEMVWGDLEYRYKEFDRIIKLTTGGWRSYGLSGIILHGNRLAILNAPLNASFPGREERMLGFHWDDLNTPFAKPKFLYRSNLDFFNPWIDTVPPFIQTPMFESVKQAFAPILVTLARSTDHNFWSGEEVTKNVYVINEAPGDVRDASLYWRLSDYEGKEMAANNIVIEKIAQGEIKSFSVRFMLPLSTKRKLLRLEVVLMSDDGTTISSDSSEITVYPRISDTLQTGMTVFLYDKIGRTSNLLKQQGINFHLIGLDELSQLSPNGSLLIIGCNSVDEEVLNGSYLFSSFVQNGGRVLIFDQETGQECSRSFAFIRAPHHPIFQGLPSHRIELWRTKLREITGSTLSYGTSLKQTILVEVVADAKDSIFSDFSPVVIEMEQGKGRMVFCNLRVTDACEEGDPEAVIMLRNLVSYTSIVSPKRPRVRYVGNEEGRQFLKETINVLNIEDVSAEGWTLDLAENSLLILGNGIKPSQFLCEKDRISSFVEKGGIVLAVVESREGRLDWTPVPIDIRKLPGAFHLWKKTDDPLLDGLGDLYILESERARYYYTGDQISGLTHGFVRPVSPWKIGYEIATTKTNSYLGLRRRPHYDSEYDGAFVFLKHGKGLYILSLLPTKNARLSTKLYSAIFTNILMRFQVVMGHSLAPPQQFRRSK